MTRTSKIERASSSEENVNIDQEDSPGGTETSINLLNLQILPVL